LEQSSADSCEFDTRSTGESNEKFRSRYTIEHVEDLSIGNNVDVFEDINNDEDEMETFGSFRSQSLRNLHIMEDSPFAQASSSNTATAEGETKLDLSPDRNRLSIEDVDDFDSYIKRLPAPYQHRIRSSQLLKSESVDNISI
jgi:hypothetical protein